MALIKENSDLLSSDSWHEHLLKELLSIADCSTIDLKESSLDALGEVLSELSLAQPLSSIEHDGWDDGPSLVSFGIEAKATLDFTLTYKFFKHSLVDLELDGFYGFRLISN